jgi:hypothetical protein
MKRFIIVGALALSLMGCQTVQSGLSLLTGHSVASQNPVVAGDVEKALTIAHLAYDGIGNQILVNKQSGLLHGATAAEVKVYYDKAGDALIVADTADKAANQDGVVSALSTATDAITQAKALIK